MAPIDAEFANSNVKPLFLIGTHASLIAGLIFTISRFVYRAPSFLREDDPVSRHLVQQTI